MKQTVSAMFVLLALTAVIAAQPATGDGPHTLPPDGPMVQIDQFYIDVYEYPNALGTLPTVNVTYREAERLCAEREKRLCTEQEWQRAATGPENYPYGYGERFESGRCNTPLLQDGAWIRGRGLAPSGSFAQCSNSYGLHDMIGNAWEWTSTWYAQEKGWRIVRGGSYFHSANMARTEVRYGRYLDAEYRLDLVGFRCCRSTSLPTDRRP